MAWATALLDVFAPGAAVWCAAAALSAAVVAVVLMRLAPSKVLRGGLAIVMLSAAGAVSISVAAVGPGRDDVSSWNGRVVEVVATISSSASPGQDGRLWVDAEVSALGPPGRSRAVSAPVRIGIDSAGGFDLGAGVRVTGEAKATEPGERAALVIFASSAAVEREASGIFAVGAALRAAFIDRAAALPEPGAGLLPGLAVGDTRAVSAELGEAMRVSGLSHLTAVSGANCAIVVAAVFWLTAFCGGGRRLRVTLALAALGGFVVLVTPEPSVIRAAVMAAVGMLTLLLGRPSAGAGLLALCATAILVGDPWLAASPGFALSVAASGALVLLAPPLARGLGRVMPSALALAVAVPLAAQVVCGPIIALFADQQSLVGIAANMLAAPAAPIGTVIGMLACLTAPLPPLADVLVAGAWLPAAWIAKTAEVTAHLPVAAVALPAGIPSALLVALVSTALVVVCVGHGRLPHASTPVWRPLVHRASVAVLIGAVSLAGARALLDGPLAGAANPEGWAIAACDVGQGDALLVRSAGAVALIDTGPEPAALDACLRSLGIARVDLLVLTHFDKDHAGGVDAVRGRVDTVLHGPTGDQADERLLARLSAGGAGIEQVAAGRTGTLGGATWRVLWPMPDSMAFPAGNDSGVVVAFDGGTVPRSLFLADLSAGPQRMLLRSARLGEYAVVKVAHHGSADQDRGLYEALRPRAALISVGAGNDYGHPRAETLDLLTAIGARVFRTDESGRILLGLRDGELRVWTQTVPP